MARLDLRARPADKEPTVTIACFLVLRFLRLCVPLTNVRRSPGWQLSTWHIFSRVSKLIPSAFPFFKRQSVVWLSPVSFANQ